jgi:hypothetical protein
MEVLNEIHRAVKQMEGQMNEICKLSERVSKLEQSVSWLKGGWAVLAGAFACMCRAAFGK